MIFHPTHLKGAFTVELEPFSDERGWFARTFCKTEFNAIGHTAEWVQLNHSCTLYSGTIRGMHYQLPPFGEIKLVRCIAGSIYDVIIDLRAGSPTFLNHYGTELSAANKRMIYIPEGFAHGFQALTDGAELIYHHSQFYTPGVEGGIRFDEPLAGINWPLEARHVSERDLVHPYLDEQFKGI